MYWPRGCAPPGRPTRGPTVLSRLQNLKSTSPAVVAVCQITEEVVQADHTGRLPLPAPTQWGAPRRQWISGPLRAPRASCCESQIPLESRQKCHLLQLQFFPPSSNSTKGTWLMRAATWRRVIKYHPLKYCSFNVILLNFYPSLYSSLIRQFFLNQPKAIFIHRHTLKCFFSLSEMFFVSRRRLTGH